MKISPMLDNKMNKHGDLNIEFLWIGILATTGFTHERASIHGGYVRFFGSGRAHPLQHGRNCPLVVAKRPSQQVMTWKSEDLPVNLSREVNRYAHYSSCQKTASHYLIAIWFCHRLQIFVNLLTKWKQHFLPEHDQIWLGIRQHNFFGTGNSQ